MSETTTADLLVRASYRHWIGERIRFCDTDMLGHANNGVFTTLAETGRVHFLERSGLPDPGPGLVWVIARIALDFRAELHWPDEVEIGTAVIRIGRSSVTLGQGIFLGDRCVASAESVVVVMDQQTRRSAPIPGALRAALAERMIGG